nr:hypothetical protein [candidate division KSB1 bacterium]
MNSKKRVHAALKKEPVDRVPIFMWYHPQTAKRLAKILEIPAHRLNEALGDDILMTWINNNYAMEGIVHEQDGESHVDEWGIQWTRIDGFNQITHYPLANATPDEMVNYKFPNDKIGSLIKRMEPLDKKRETYFVGCDASPSAFELYWRLRGMEGTMIDIAENPKLAETMIHHCTEFSLRLSETACDRFELDWLWAGDDIGGQTGMMLSPQTWQTLIKPYLKQLFDVAKSNGIYAAFHSCGAIRPIIGDLVEMGLDVLNP